MTYTLAHLHVPKSAYMAVAIRMRDADAEQYADRLVDTSGPVAARLLGLDLTHIALIGDPALEDEATVGAFDAARILGDIVGTMPWENIATAPDELLHWWRGHLQRELAKAKLGETTWQTAPTMQRLLDQLTKLMRERHLIDVVQPVT